MQTDDKDPPEDSSKAVPKGKPANAAPDAVMDPNEKTEGKPGEGPKGGAQPDGETDPGGS
ncbi:hypothetical protein [Methylobacterium sp. J-068]|uniref:hypothetical protein n=1 Tax=Methylobacterium sp. J-068 TaxID=2836649 RepID=UPI001FBB26CE|nr:hypothetical protein [Methylobacterium sp. J-068]MCJ2036948.1 hypothetical protein [Methylobacterium sp. J-068]